LRRFGEAASMRLAMSDDPDLIGPDEVAFRLELTPPELRVVNAALRSYFDDFGHDEREVHEIVRRVLAKLPDPASLT
jgi:hypothetical protein